MNTKQYLNDFYNVYDEDGRLASKHGKVEFLTTMRYVEKYFQPESRILEMLNLSSIADCQYDMTLLLGPLYHLYTLEDKKQTISEAIRVTKP